MKRRGHLETISLISLGCPKNLVDSERLLGSFAEAGLRVSSSPLHADAVVINTCGFIRPAKEESLEVIEEIIDLKNRNIVKTVVVAGCLGEEMGELIKSRFPEIDFVTGVLGRENIERTFNFLKGENDESRVLEEFPRLPLTAGHYGYLRIADGCDNRCGYCLIPSFRGAFKSEPMEELVDEAKFFAGIGCKELILIAQDTTSYGDDLYGEKKLPELLRELSRIDGIEWLRIMYTHPAHFTDELIDEIGKNPRVVKYLDIPLQHINDRILESMGRKVTKSEIAKLIKKLRSKVKGLFIRTTFIVGFPGESEEEFEELVDFVRRERFERVGVFTYSREKGTKAYNLERQIPEPVKEKRRNRLMSVQQEIAFEINESMKGKEIDVLVESAGDTKGTYIGRFYGDAPEIDNCVYLKGKNLRIGEIYPAVVTGRADYDLKAKAKRR